MDFSALPAAPPRRAFTVSILLHCLLIALLGTVWESSPKVRRLVERATLMAPVRDAPDRPVAVKPAPVIRRPAFLAPRYLVPAPEVALPAAPVAAAPKLAPVPLPPPALPASAPLPAPKPVIRTDVFAGVTTPPVANPKPSLAVETGAFQTPVSNQKAAARPVAKTGEFDIGERQTRETPVKVAAAGFGDAQSSQAVASPRGVVGSRGDAGFGAVTAAKAPAETKAAVRTGGFDANMAAPVAPAKRQMEQAPPREVEIFFKPRPAYSDEARKLKIEGEVLVEVVFTASGVVRVLRVAKGLGHGLDEAATQAAASIRFKPAERGGVAVDSTAIARITFQLAY